MRLGRPVAFSATLLLVASVLSGCLGPAQLTALEAQESADPVAMEWDPEARLIFAAGLEGRVDNEMLRDMLRSGAGFQEMGFETLSEEDEQGVPYWDRIEEDGQPGNGKMELWVLHYAVEGSDGELVLLVDRDGEILHEEQRSESPYDEPVGAYEVDSDRAMRTAKRASGELRGLLDSDNLIVGSGLLLDPSHGGPVWTISGLGGDVTGVQGAVVQVDAVTGDVIHKEGETFRE